jgi:excisionase family DNA binding protein
MKPVQLDPDLEELKLLSIDELAELLGVHRGSILNMVKRGDLKPAPLPLGRVMFTRAEVRRILGL